MAVCIRDIAYALPETALTNDALKEENPDWNMQRVETRAGVRCRYVAAEWQTSLDLGLEACGRLFDAHPDLPERIDALLFCTETADHILPPNACILHGKLGLPDRVFAMDIDLGCSGYPYSLAVARGLVATGVATNVLVVNADTYSKFIPKQDMSTRVLFGDGAAASWIGGCRDNEGVIDIAYGTAGSHYDKFIIPAGGCRLPRADAQADQSNVAGGNGKPLDAIQMDGLGILSFVNAKIPPHLRELLERNQLQVSDVDLFVIHQASRMVLDSLARLLGIRPEQLFSNLSEVGNLVSASIPIALKSAWQDGRLSAGHTVVLCGFGLGLSWGSVLMRWPAMADCG